MARRVAVIAEGRHYRLARTDTYLGIWRRRLWSWRLVSRYPLSEEAWRVAQQQFALLEPPPAPVPWSAQAPGEGTRRRSWGWWVGLGGLGLLAAAVVVIVVAAPLPGGSSGRTSVGRNSFTGATSPVASVVPTTLAPPTTQEPPTTIGFGTPVGSGWLSSSGDEVDFFQWTQNGLSLEGNLTYVQLRGQAPQETSRSQVVPVNGAIQGAQVTLSVNGGTQMFGTLNGDTLTLNIPQSGGTLAPESFNQASTAQYNQAVSALVSQAVDANDSGSSPNCATIPCLPVPPPPTGYQTLATIPASVNTTPQVTFAGSRLAICWAVSSPSVGTLSYQIGTSFSGATNLFDSTTGDLVTNGCVSDPGNDTGPQTVSTTISGTGSYIVAIYQAG